MPVSFALMQNKVLSSNPAWNSAPACGRVHKSKSILQAQVGLTRKRRTNLPIASVLKDNGISNALALRAACPGLVTVHHCSAGLVEAFVCHTISSCCTHQSRIYEKMHLCVVVTIMSGLDCHKSAMQAPVDQKEAT